MLIGIDFGTTILKAAAFDRSTGKLLAMSMQRLQIEIGDDGRRELTAPVIDNACRQLFADLQAQLGSKWSGVSGIGIAAQGGSMMIVTRQGGMALTPMTLWNDARAYSLRASITAGRSPEYWREFSLRDEPGMGLARLLWLRQRQPELIHPDNIYTGAGDYLYYCLTGQWLQDPCHALQTGCYDARHNALIQEPMDIVDVPLSFVPPLRVGHPTNPLSVIAARAFNLPEGIPVAGPYNDHEAAFMSVGKYGDRLCNSQSQLTSKIGEKYITCPCISHPLQCSLGTAWVGNFILPEGMKGRAPFQLVIPAPAGFGQLILQPLLTGNVTWDWALEILVDHDHRQALQKQKAIFEERLLPPYGLITIPWLNRPHPMLDGVNGAGCFFGISPAVTTADLVRSVAVDMCCEFARMLGNYGDRLCISQSQVNSQKGEKYITCPRISPFDGIILSGGASKGRQFRQILQALFMPLPLYQVTDEDWMGARGSLYALNTPASNSTLNRSRRDACDPSEMDEIQRHYQLYTRVYNDHYGHINAGKPFSFEE